MLPEALPYHLSVRDHFKQHSSTWEFFAAAQTRQEQWADCKTKLLNNAAPLQQDINARLYASIHLAMERLDLGNCPVSVWQMQSANATEMNAGIIYLYPEIMFVLNGPVQQRLKEPELLAVVAHALSRVRLYRMAEGDLEVTDRIVSAVARRMETLATGGSAAVYAETARRFKKYTEIFCDRGALAVVGDSAAVITGLVKMATGLPEVTAAHAENFTRARAIQLWQDKGEQAESLIQKMIAGPLRLDRLDVFSQAQLHAVTRGILLELLRPEWTHTPLVLSLAHGFFPDLSWNGIPEIGIAGKLGTILAESDKSVHDYFSNLLLDLAMADPKLGNRLSGRVTALAGEAGLSPWPFDKKNYQQKT